MNETLLRRIFGVALLAHVIGNWHQPNLPSLVGWIELAVGCLGIALVMFPLRAIWLTAAGATIVSVVGEIPKLGNHWLLAGLASLLIVLTGGRSGTLESGLRWVLIVFYAFAAFAKLNSGFFDTSVSCAVFYSNQSLTSWSLPVLSPASTAARAVIWATVAVELSVVPLLAWRRTRWHGLMLASIFHGLISLDLGQHFYDFTAVLYFYFAAFVPHSGSEPPSSRLSTAILKWAAVPASFGLVLLSVLPSTDLSIRMLTTAPFLLWVPFAGWWVRHLGRQKGGTSIDWSLKPLAAAVVAVALLNGLTPYLELKTAYSFNMYSNLLTAQGETNHLIVRRTWPLRNGYADPVEILSTSDKGLELYRERGYLIPYPQFQQYLVGRSVVVTYRRGSAEFVVDDTHDAGIANTGPWWWRVMPLRALDQFSPPRCQDVFLPAL